MAADPTGQVAGQEGPQGQVQLVSRQHGPGSRGLSPGSRREGGMRPCRLRQRRPPAWLQEGGCPAAL